MGLGIPPHRIKILLESNPLKSRILVRRLGVLRNWHGGCGGEDPFKNVKSLITDMVKRLEGEMSSDAKEKAYCDSEMKKTQGRSGSSKGARVGGARGVTTHACFGIRSRVREIR